MLQPALSFTQSDSSRAVTALTSIAALLQFCWCSVVQKRIFHSYFVISLGSSLSPETHVWVYLQKNLLNSFITHFYKQPAPLFPWGIPFRCSVYHTGLPVAGYTHLSCTHLYLHCKGGLVCIGSAAFRKNKGPVDAEPEMEFHHLVLDESLLWTNAVCKIRFCYITQALTIKGIFL